MTLPRLFRTPAVPLALAAVVLAASAAATAALISHDDAGAGDSPPPPLRNAVWSVDAARDATELSTLSGAWLSADTFVRGSEDGLHAVHRADGTVAWDWPVPYPGGIVCAMSGAPDSGVGIVTMTTSAAAACTKIAALDLPTGKVLWTADASTVFGDPAADAPTVTTDHGMTILQSSHATKLAAVALNTRNGTVSWTQTTPCPHSLRSAPVAADGRLALVENCAGDQAKILVLSSYDGTLLSTYTAPPLKTDPAVVGLAPLTVVDDMTHPTSVAIAPTPTAAPVAGPDLPLTPVPVTGLDSLFTRLTTLDFQSPRAASVPTVTCLSGTTLQCFTPSGDPLPTRIHGTPIGATVPIQSPDGALRLLVVPVPGQTPRATVVRISAAGAVTTEAELSLPVSAFVSASTATALQAYGTPADLVLTAHNPAAAGTAVLDVR